MYSSMSCYILVLSARSSLCINSQFGNLRVRAFQRSRVPSFTDDRFSLLMARPTSKLIWFILIGSVPTGVIAIAFKQQLEALFVKPTIVAVMLMTTGVILQLPRLRRSTVQEDCRLRFWHSPLIGIAQGLAITPGISRSGATISMALLLGISAKKAARFSFLLSIPAILGAVLLKIKDVASISVDTTAVVVGTLTSFLVGYIALRVLLSVLDRGKFSGFSYYCFALGIGVFIFRMLS